MISNQFRDSTQKEKLVYLFCHLARFSDEGLGVGIGWNVTGDDLFDEFVRDPPEGDGAVSRPTHQKLVVKPG